MSWEQAVGLEWQVWRSGAQEGRGTKSRLQSNCQRDPWATDSPDKQCRRHWETKAGSDSQLPGPCTAQLQGPPLTQPLGPVHQDKSKAPTRKLPGWESEAQSQCHQTSPIQQNGKAS